MVSKKWRKVGVKRGVKRDPVFRGQKWGVKKCRDDEKWCSKLSPATFLVLEFQKDTQMFQNELKSHQKWFPQPRKFTFLRKVALFDTLCHPVRCLSVSKGVENVHYLAQDNQTSI